MKYNTLLFLLLSINIFAQNLVLNPSFEETKSCANDISTFERHIKKWSKPSLSTTDLYNSCSKSDVGTPYNAMGSQFPKNGENYAGIILYGKGNYREYVQGELSEPLKKDAVYNITFYVSLAENSHFAIKNMDILFSNQKIYMDTKKNIKTSYLDAIESLKYSLISIDGKEYFRGKSKWMKIKASYISKGGEKYFTIGNFRKNSKTDYLKMRSSIKEELAYYYLDHVSISPKYPEKKEIEIITPKEKEVFTTNKTYIFENVTFEYDSYELSNAAKTEIEEVYVFLRDTKQAVIKIMGHTDNMGGEDFNQELSENRAKAVANYLIDLGISEDRVSAKGFGEKEPVTTNDTEEGREQNRRVAFEFIK
ncbi:OmpA family protein [Aureivirga sp. CE67]|uniref:OmpA family protein n=1 Tax=Aureivirga sp. CE67 TaxID=1788983 RepID=UPI0018C94E91|nr:OmpA family protein [Aureivirga sp. CE67]